MERMHEKHKSMKCMTKKIKRLNASYPSVRLCLPRMIQSDWLRILSSRQLINKVSIFTII